MQDFIRNNGTVCHETLMKKVRFDLTKKCFGDWGKKNFIKDVKRKDDFIYED